MTAPVIGIVGWKNAGKTSLVERLVAELVSRGLRVATVKHAHHDFDVDVPGTDSYRHRKAGAHEVAIVSSRRWALMHELGDEPEPALDDVLTRLSPADIIIVEGYKREKHPKIELRRSGQSDNAPLAPADSTIIAVAADHAAETGGLPLLQIDNTVAIADFILGALPLEQTAR